MDGKMILEIKCECLSHFVFMGLFFLEKNIEENNK